MRVHRLVVLCLLAGAAAAPVASAAGTPFNVQVLALNGDGTAQYSPCGIGGSYTFPTLPGAAVGQVWAVDVDLSTTPWTISNEQLTDLPPCMGSGPGFGPPGAPTGPIPPGFSPGPGQTFGPGGIGGPGTSGDDDAPTLAAELPRFAFNRVFTFRCDADGFADGELSVTINAIAGLGKTIRDDFNAAVDDQDGLVLVGKFVKVFTKKGKRVRPRALDDADSVAVRGKLLRPSQWHEDEDGNQVPTIRAKRITITG